MEEDRFHSALKLYVDNGFSRSGSAYDGADFAQGCGNLVFNGDWTVEAHGSEGRLAHFDSIIEMFKAAGMS